MTRSPINFELIRREMYVSKAWRAHSTFTPEEVAHVTTLNNTSIGTLHTITVCGSLSSLE